MQSSLTPCDYRSSESCGYCKDAAAARTAANSHSRASYYALSKALTVDVYQLLVDRGWRSLPAASFKPSKDQRQAVNRWNSHVLGEAYTKDAARLHPLSKEDKARFNNTFDLVREVHRAELPNVKQPPQPAHRFEVTLEPAAFSTEKYHLFNNYQQTVHKQDPDEITQAGFKSFLCVSPLKHTSRTVNAKEQLLGSYHQCYRLDGRLVAMGVLDLLPHCVSAVYLLYHSDFAEWQFGKLSALREAALALEGGYEYYYMGYYIHSCTKMKYKGDYKTQHVLDPESYEWHPLDAELRRLLDKKKYVSMSRERRRLADQAAQKDGTSDADAPEHDDDYSDYPLPTAAQAVKAVKEGMSLFELKVPGLMTAEEIEQKVDLDSMPVRIGDISAELQDLVSWETSDLRNPETIKGTVGEMVAAMGPEAAWQIVIQLE